MMEFLFLHKGGWDTQVCVEEPRVSLWRRGKFWHNSWDCWHVCKSDLDTKIEQGFPDAQCVVQIGAAHCEMGYNTDQSACDAVPGIKASPGAATSPGAGATPGTGV
jgi:hypothetical protein